MMVLFPATKVLKKMHIYKKNAVFYDFIDILLQKTFIFPIIIVPLHTFLRNRLYKYHYANYNN